MRISFEVVETLGEGSFGVVTKNKAPTCSSYTTININSLQSIVIGSRMPMTQKLKMR